MNKNYLIKHDKDSQEFHIFNYFNQHIGRVYYEFNYHNNEKYVKLNLLKINEEYKKLGYGSILLNYVIDYFKSEKYEKIFVLAEPYGKSYLKLNQEKLLKWYFEKGFIEAYENLQPNTRYKHLLMLNL